VNNFSRVFVLDRRWNVRMFVSMRFVNGSDANDHILLFLIVHDGQPADVDRRQWKRHDASEVLEW
jgi:hypothetical protein